MLIRNFFIVETLKWVKLEWIDVSKSGVKYTFCEEKDGLCQLIVSEPKHKIIKFIINKIKNIWLFKKMSQQMDK